MKILQIINSLSTGGAEKLIIDSVPLYQKQGLTVDVLLLNNTETQFKSHLKETSKGKFDGLTLGSIYNPFLIFKIIPYLKKYDIIHLHLFPTLYWVVLAKWISFSKVKLIYTEHSTHNRRRGNLLFKLLDRFIYKKLNAITAITEGVKIQLQKHLKNKNNIVVINNGINIDDFSCKITSDFSYFSKNDFKLIQVSSFREQKDQATIIRSLKYLPENVKLLLVGDGDLLEENKRLATKLDVSDRVRFLGNRYDIPQLMNYADVAILSSHWEGFGLAIIEGMAAGKPAIACDIEGVREIVNGYGLLFKQGDEKDLAKHIKSLLGDSQFYQEIAAKCKSRAKDFDINVMVEKFIHLYKEVLND